MKIDVPEPRLNDAWRIGAWHLLRNCKKDKNGRYDIEDFPYPTCGLETEVIMHALDLMGMHAAAQDGLARWATQWVCRQGNSRTATGVSWTHGIFRKRRGRHNGPCWSITS